LPAVIAPIVVAPADMRTRAGVLQQTTVESDSRGPGSGGGAGTGAGTGLGQGDGGGIGPGSGGGTGGGPYRPGSGIEAPHAASEGRLQDARQRGVPGDVVLEIVVSVTDRRRREGAAGPGRRLKSTARCRPCASGGSPARRQGAAVDDRKARWSSPR
jgi:hypothetical protein